MARMRLLDVVRPFALTLPEVQLPYQKVDSTERLVYTVVAAVAYVLLAEVPLYGVPEAMERADPISWLRAGLGMSNGTLASFGVVPIVLSGVSIQILAGIRRISVSLDVRSDRALFQSLQKLVALGIAATLSALVATATPSSSPRMGLFVAMQLFLGSGVLIYTDEVLSKDYGMVTGTVLFPLVRAAQQFTWSALSLASVPVPGKDGAVTLGALPSLFFGVRNRSFGFALTDFVFRTDAPNLLDIATGVVVFCLTLYLGMVRLNLQVRSTRMRAQSSTFPVRLAYAGAQPVLFATSLLAAFLLTSHSLCAVLGPHSVVSRVLGVWDAATAVPISGLAAFLVPTFGRSVFVSVARAAVYTLVLTAVGGLIGQLWTQSSGFAPQDVAKSFKENSIVLVGRRDVSVVKELRRVIPLAATLGGMISGLLVAVADIIGPAGWGATMSIAAMSVFSVFEQLASEGMVGPDALQGLT